MWWVEMRAMGLLLASGGGTGTGSRGLGLRARGPWQGVIWTQGWLRPRYLPSLHPRHSLGSRGSGLWSRVGSKGQTGQRERRENLGERGGTEWCFVF